MQRESLTYDVVIVGAGPAGLSAAIRLTQLAQQQQRELSVCVLEKGSQVGAHILSGAVLEPRALDELLPNWRELGAPLHTPVAGEKFLALSATRAYQVPRFLLPRGLHNTGNYVISLGELCVWLAQQAEEAGVELYPGFAAVEVLYDTAENHAANRRVIGVATGAMGLQRDGQPGPRYEPGIELYAEHTLFAEGCRGSLGKQLINEFELEAGCQPQTYGIGIKELWEVDSAEHQPGQVIHTTGWPLPRDSYGGGFLYHLHDHKVAVGLVIGLDYRDPWLDPFAEMQRFKTHPSLRGVFRNARRIGYGARALNEGGLQSLPRLSFPGGMLLGCEAGTLNVVKIKGIHTAMKSGMLAAETILNATGPGADYHNAFRASWAGRELHRARNVRPAFKWGRAPGMLYAAVDQLLLGGLAPWTLRHRGADHDSLRPARQMPARDYPRPDGVLTFDRASSVFLSNTHHRDDEPSHLHLRDTHLPVATNLQQYQGPEQRYCPAGVYEFVPAGTGVRLQINAANCVHCKTCDIKDPEQNITWVPPEGGGGPNYNGM